MCDHISYVSMFVQCVIIFLGMSLCLYNVWSYFLCLYACTMCDHISSYVSMFVQCVIIFLVSMFVQCVVIIPMSLCLYNVWSYFLCLYVCTMCDHMSSYVSMFVQCVIICLLMSLCLYNV